MGTIYIAAFLVACASSFTATPFAIWFSKRLGVLDRPDPRKVHRVPIPRWGGLGIYLGILMAILGTYIGFPRFRQLLSYRYPMYFHGEMIMEVFFEPVDEGTRVTLVFKNIPAGIRPEDNEKGTELSLQKLDKYVTRKA